MTQPFRPEDLTDERVDEVFGEIRQVIDDAPAAAKSDLVDSPELVNKVNEIVDDRYRRRHFPAIMIGVGVILVLVIVAGSMLLPRIGALEVASSNQDAAQRRSEQTIEAFKGQLAATNASLVAQGLPPILAPEDVAPGTPEQAQLISAAGAATAIDKIAKQDKVAPGTGADSKAVARIVAEQVSAFMSTNPVSVPPDVIFQQVAAYASANQERLRGAQGVAGVPGTPGAPGEEGPPGPPVTAEQLRSAFAEEVQRNPNTLCPVGGTYGARQLALAGGGSTTQYGCFNSDQSAPENPPVTGGGQGAGEQTSGAPAPPEDGTGG